MKETYCVVVEGEKTERLYFEDAKKEHDALHYQLAQEARNRGIKNFPTRSLVVVVAGGLSFENVVKTALKQVGLGHEKIYCVVDADFYVRLSKADRRKAEDLYEDALSKGIEMVLSNPCFEVWFRHHFNAHTSAWRNGSTAKQEIQNIWSDYEAKPKRHWDLLRDKQLTAIDNARKVRTQHGCPPALVEDHDASSDVDWLILDLFCS